MLTKFVVKNYRGFSERVEWNLSRHRDYDFNSFVIRDGIIKNGIIYGANGSGKSNLGLALFDIENHLSAKWKKVDYFDNYTYAGNKDLIVDFEYHFKFPNYNIKYNYSKNYLGVILNEQMEVNSETIFSTYNNFYINKDKFSINDSAMDNLKNNANKISIINYLLNFYPLPKDHYLILLLQFVNSMLWFKSLDSREFIGLEASGSANIEEFIIKNNLIKDFSDFLESVSGQIFIFPAHQPNEKMLFCEIDGNSVPFSLIASTGTKTLELLYYWLKRMNTASFVFIDEFDAFYHYRVSYEVCKRLFNLDTQVFLSSHNTYLMKNDLLRPDCNFIIDGKNIKPLCDCTEKDLQFGHNIEKLFRGNAFKI